MFIVPPRAEDPPASNQAEPEPAGRARRCSRLRALVAPALVLLALGSMVSRELARIERQRAAVAAIEKLGGAVEYEGSSMYGGPERWLTNWLGRDALDSVKAVYLSGTRAGNADLACILALPRVKTIGLASTGITDAGLPYLRTAPRLIHVDLRFTAVSPAAAAALRRALPEAKVLSRSDVE
jgi:hypothetical protein